MRLGKLEGSCTPAALMDPDIGDETLLFWMQQLAGNNSGKLSKRGRTTHGKAASRTLDPAEPRATKAIQGLPHHRSAYF